MNTPLPRHRPIIMADNGKGHRMVVLKGAWRGTVGLAEETARAYSNTYAEGYEIFIESTRYKRFERETK